MKNNTLLLLTTTLLIVAFSCNKIEKPDTPDDPQGGSSTPTEPVELPKEVFVNLKTEQTPGEDALEYTRHEGLDDLTKLCGQIAISTNADISCIDIWAAAGEQMTGEFTVKTSGYKIITEDITNGRESRESKGPRDKVTIKANGAGAYTAMVLPAEYACGLYLKFTNRSGRCFIKYLKSRASVKAGQTLELGQLTPGSWEAASVPQMFITTTDDLTINELKSKDTYLMNYVHVEGCGVSNVNEPGEIYLSTGASGRIKGRGNSTWNFVKKPYRLKMDRKVRFCGFKKAKDYVLLADFIDGTHMLNAVAFKAAKIVGMEYSNTAVPVDLWLNGTYKGSYCLTEQVEVDENRVNIPKESGILLEFDTGYDEDYKFYSSAFSLPVMLKDPDEAAATFTSYWQGDFNKMASSLNTNASKGNVDYGLDLTSAAQYLLVYNLMHNMELNHPKSVYVHKTMGGQYILGPIWDFDWSADFETTYQTSSNTHFKNSNTVLLGGKMGTSKPGYKFFSTLLKDPRVVAEYDRLWNEFKTTGLNELLDYIDSYGEILRESALKDGELWDSTRSSWSLDGGRMDEKSSDFVNRKAKLRQWIIDRANFMSSEITSGKRCGVRQ